MSMTNKQLSKLNNITTICMEHIKILMFLNTEGNREKHTNTYAFLNIFIQFNKQILMQRYKDLSFHTEKYSKDNGI